MLTIGSYELQAFRMLALTAVAVEYAIVVKRAPRHGFTSEQASSLIAWATVLGLASAHIFDVIAYYPERLRNDPLELFRVWGSLSSWGGMVGGLCGLAFVAWRRGLGAAGVLRFVDLAVYALPITLAVGRFGCALQHDHLGVASTHFLAVNFPTGPRFDLGLLEFLYLIPVSLMLRRARPEAAPARLLPGPVLRALRPRALRHGHAPRRGRALLRLDARAVPVRRHRARGHGARGVVAAPRR